MRLINNTIRIGVLGNVDSGKTTLVGVMTKMNEGEYDDGRGLARSKIFVHQHEKESGRTSAITKETMRKDNKVIEFVDLAGHEKYFRTTVRGICNNCVDYVLLLVNGNMGNLTKMTHEHLYLVLSLRIPVIVLITKVDMAPDNIINETIDNIKQILKRNKIFSYVIKGDEDLEKEVFKNYMSGDDTYNLKLVPILKISNKTGYNLELLKDFLFKLERVFNFNDKETNKKFIINNIYNLNGIGMVLSGICYRGTIMKGDILTMNIYNNLIRVQVKTLHDDFQNSVDELYIGESGCLAIKILDKYFSSNLKSCNFKKKYIRSGSIIMEVPEVRDSFKAKILVSNHSVTIKEKYQPIINSMSINQAAMLQEIIEKDNEEASKNILRCREIALVKFKFLHHPEFINKDQYFIFRDGRIKGIGKVVE
jgi:GTPase